MRLPKQEMMPQRLLDRPWVGCVPIRSDLFQLPSHHRAGALKECFRRRPGARAAVHPAVAHRCRWRVYRYAHWPFTSIYVPSTYPRRPACWCRLRRKCSARGRPNRTSQSRTVSWLNENPLQKHLGQIAQAQLVPDAPQHHPKHNVRGPFQEIERCRRALIERPFAALTPEPQIAQPRGLGKRNWVWEWATWAVHWFTSPA